MSDEAIAKMYRDEKDCLVFVSSGISGGAVWMTVRQKKPGAVRTGSSRHGCRFGRHQSRPSRIWTPMPWPGLAPGLIRLGCGVKSSCNPASFQV